MKSTRTAASMPVQFTHENGKLHVYRCEGEGILKIEALGFSLELEHGTLRPERWSKAEGGVIKGVLNHGNLPFTVEWIAEGSTLRKRLHVEGAPPAGWGRLLRLVIHQQELGDEEEITDATMGWRESAFSADAVESLKIEEGSGRLPSCGYPLFLKREFVGVEHPMGFSTASEDGSAMELFHHPIWGGQKITSEWAVFGHAEPEASVREAFLRYFSQIRKPRRQTIEVEINTFWTDPLHVDERGNTAYSVSLPAYRAIAEGWINEALDGEKGLITGLLLDAGWSSKTSLYTPTATLGGPSDAGLASLADELKALGLSLGLWISTNGPIGVHPAWAAAEGYQISSTGYGAAYSAGGEKAFICLDDARWEADFSSRIAGLNANVSVAAYKCDWDNEGITSPTQAAYPRREIIWEENVNTMIRLFRAMAPRRPDGLPGIRVRGAWWLSPWWFMHVDSTHLPHSGDLEYSALPVMTPREASITSRDMLLYEHLILHRTPLPWDVIDSHDFAHAPRCPVVDSEESWLHSLIAWLMRGAQTIQLYAPPYGIHGWRAKRLRQTLRWLRDHEALLLHAEHQWLGGNPGLGEIYGVHHALGDEELMMVRNPIGSPQGLPSVLADTLSQRLQSGRWQQIFPTRCEAALRAFIGSNEMLVFQRSSRGAPFCCPEERTIPALHQIAACSLKVLGESNGELQWSVEIPHHYEEAVLIMEWEGKTPLPLHIASGRYADGISSAPLPVTWLTPHWRASYTENRSGLMPSRWNKVIARVPLPTGGLSYLTIRKPFQMPAALWVEGHTGNEEEEPSSRFLPLPKQARHVIVSQLDS